MRSKFAVRSGRLRRRCVLRGASLSARPVNEDPKFTIYEVLLRDHVTLVTDNISRLTEDAKVDCDGTRLPVWRHCVGNWLKAYKYLWPAQPTITSETTGAHPTSASKAPTSFLLAPTHDRVPRDPRSTVAGPPILSQHNG